MAKIKWIAGYPNYMDWYLVPDTPENNEAVGDFDGDEYATFAEAKKALIEIVKDRIAMDKAALRSIRKIKKSAV